MPFEKLFDKASARPKVPAAMKPATLVKPLVGIAGLLALSAIGHAETNATELRKQAGTGREVESSPADIDRSEANKKAALEFFQLILGDRDYEAARKFAGDYVQHDPRIGDGFDALVEALETNPIWKDRPKSRVDFKNVAADGNLVYFQTHRSIKAKDDGSPARLLVTHLFRFDEHGKIAEHWTQTQSVKLSESASKHPLF